MRLIYSIGSLAMLAASFIPSTAVSAADLKSISGRVTVNTGGGFTTATGPTGLRPGDRVMVGQNSSARVEYDDHCIVKVLPGAVYTVKRQSPCRDGAGRLLHAGHTKEMIVGGLVAAGIGAGVYALTRKSDKHFTPPSSP